MLPLLLPLHDAFTIVELTLRANVGCVIVTVFCAVQPCESVVVSVYVPADKLLAFAPLMPPGDHEYE